MSLSKEVQTAIQKELPNMVASELQEYIAQSEQLKKDYDSLKTAFGAGERNNQELKKAVEQLTALKNSADLLKEERETLKEAQRDLKVKIAEINRDAAIAAKNDIYQLTHGLFRNTAFKRTVMDSVPMPVTSYDYQTGRPLNTNPVQFATHKETTDEPV